MRKLSVAHNKKGMRSQVLSHWAIIAVLAPMTLSLTLGLQDPDSREFEEGSNATEIFLDRAQDVGIDFVHFNGMSGEHYFCEMMGAGGAVFDYDNDGDLDLYLVQGHMLGPERTLSDAVFSPPDSRPLTDRLYRNDLHVEADGRRRLRFTDVTEGEWDPGAGLRDGCGNGRFQQ